MALCSYWCVVNEAWCRWGAAWGDVVRAADPLCRRAFEADGGRIYHEAWCGWGAAWGDSHLGRAQSRLRARPHRASCSDSALGADYYLFSCELVKGLNV